MYEKDIYTKIVLNNARRERSLSSYACLSSSGARRKPEHEKIPDRENIRPTFFHDTDRIIHSNTYARYIDKTQVFYLFENDHVTHRVLHVQFVSKIGRVIGRSLQLNEDLIEAISLGHDLGHVPYGHDGERFLDKICIENQIGYFCHNAQSVRCLMEIENKGEGLNLSLQVLDGILCHNGELLYQQYKPISSKNWQSFLKEYQCCLSVKDFSKQLCPMTLEGCVVRISDIIAYVGRDIEDAITVGLIERDDIPESITKVLGNNNADIINRLVLDLIENSYGSDCLSFSDEIFNSMKSLIDFNYQNIYLNKTIRSENEKIERMFRMLFEKLYSDLMNNVKDSPIFEDYLNFINEQYKSTTSPARQVIDFISGMTDDYFNNLFKAYYLPKNYGYCVDGKEKIRNSNGSSL